MRTALALLGTCAFAFWIVVDAFAAIPDAIYTHKCASCRRGGKALSAMEMKLEEVRAQVKLERGFKAK